MHLFSEVPGSTRLDHLTELHSVPFHKLVRTWHIRALQAEAEASANSSETEASGHMEGLQEFYQGKRHGDGEIRAYY